jgi:hypothetical protein
VDQFANVKLAKKGLSDDLDDYYDDDDEYAYESIEGIRLSKRYYKDRLIYMVTRKSRRGPKPCREDYLIYPESQENYEEIEAIESAPVDTADETPDIDVVEQTATDEADNADSVADTQ